MNWASRRRAIYLLGVAIFFLIVVGGPVAYWYLTRPATCTDGVRNQDETQVDRGGSCPYLDEGALQPSATLWARSFRVRDGFYNAAAYVQNPNPDAGVRRARYRFGLYDSRNILIAEREGSTFIVPGGITPILESRIDTGSRVVSRTYIELEEGLLWERFEDPADSLTISSRDVSSVDSTPRISAIVKNRAVTPIIEPSFVVVVFDQAGNAFAASATQLDAIEGGASADIVFSWPDPFPAMVSKIDITPLVAPKSAKGQ